MSKRKKKLAYPKERAILSDVLPFEVPVAFSNRHLYKFIVDNNIEIVGNKINYKTKHTGVKREAFKILFEILFSKNLVEPDFRRIPFNYRICHKENSFRELGLIHPINQLKLIEFYDQFKESIIYSCSVSNYSIRKPDNIAKFTYFNDQLHQKNKGEISDFLELSGKEYENLKTYFSYKRYTNIYKFYEDYRFHRAEKKYNHLFRFDISTCFDSIYTHSIAWAVLGADSVKENVNASKKTFPGLFDSFIQNSNYGETNGILIGPEFSRIFAEIILQHLDKVVETKLIERGFFLKKHYELYRYVDDYFLFCDNELLKNDILVLIKHELKRFKMSINDAKCKDYNKPIITEISIAKEKVIEIFSNEPTFSIVEQVKSESIEEYDDKVPSLINHNFNLYFDSKKLITKYKIIIKESLVHYKDVLNYSLAVLNNKIEANLIKFEKAISSYIYLKNKGKLSKNDIRKVRGFEDSLASHLEGFLDFVFFIYSVSPRVNSTIKVCQILSKVVLFYKEKVKLEDGTLLYKYSEKCRDRVFKKILDEVSLILNKNTLNEFAQIETQYLLILLRDLDKQYRLPEFLLSKYINAENLNGEISIKSGSLNYLSIVVSFFYIGHSKKYPKLKKALIDYTYKYISVYPVEKREKSSEITHLVLDLLACPFLSLKNKQKVLSLYRSDRTLSDLKASIKDSEKLKEFHKEHKSWFIKWDRFNIAKELENKKSQEVYS